MANLTTADAGAIELAYGLLWHVPVDTRTSAGRNTSLARKALLGLLDKDGQARGITAARVCADQPLANDKSSEIEHILDEMLMGAENYFGAVDPKRAGRIHIAAAAIRGLVSPSTPALADLDGEK